MITLGIVGFGLSGRYLQAPFFLKNPNFRLKTIVTRNQNPTASYPSVLKAESLDDLISDTTIDLISLCSPNETHFDYAQKCLLAGKHILVEKPFTATAEEAKTLFDLGRKVGKHIFIFQNRRFDSDFLTVKKVIESGILGEIWQYEAHFNRYKPILNPKKWKEMPNPANGILYDLGSHILDQTLALFGDPLSIAGDSAVSGEVFTQREGSDVDDAFEVRLNYGRLKVLLKSSLLVRADTPRYVIHGTLGSFIKYGIDVQEDHLKLNNMMPNDHGFGVEPVDNQAHIHFNQKGIAVKGRVETEVGNWMPIFQNIYDTINGTAQPLITEDQILAQMRILEKVKRG